MAIGRVPLADAKQQAIEANAWVTQQGAAPRLVDRLSGATLSLEQWLTDWTDRLEERQEAKPNTLKSYRSLARAVAGEVGAVPVGRLSVRDVAEALETIEEERGRRTAQAARSMLKTALTAAMARGHCDANPALSTEAISVTVQRQRFTWETFSKVWAHVQDAPAWLRNAVALALVSGQRREDVTAAAFVDFDGELWRCTQEKTGRKVAIPLDLRLDVLGLSLRDVLAACRRTGVVSRYLVHQVKPYGNSPVGAAIFPDTLTKRFTEAVESALAPARTCPPSTSCAACASGCTRRRAAWTRRRCSGTPPRPWASSTGMPAGPSSSASGLGGRRWHGHGQRSAPIGRRGFESRSAIGRVPLRVAITAARNAAADLPPLKPIARPTVADAKGLVYARAVARKRRHAEPALTREEFDAIWTRANGRCELTGIAFSLDCPKGCARRPWFPSLDRVDGRRGYVASNCRLVCTAVNLALNDFGEEVFKRIARSFLVGFDRSDVS
jgi:integrase